MGKFNKLINQGKQMAGKYIREQLNESQGNRQPAPHTRDQPRTPQASPQDSRAGHSVGRQGRSAAPRTADEVAIAKYKYMLRTAPPEDMERAHTEAFDRLTPEQRDLLQTELNGQLPDNERSRSNHPEDLARSATRAEVKHPGFMQKILGGNTAADAGHQGGRRSGAGLGGMAAGAAGGLGVGLLGGVAGAFIGSAAAGPLLEGFSGLGDELAGATDGLGDMAGGLEDSAAGLGDAASGLGDSATAAGEEALGNGGGLLGGLFDAGKGFLNGGGEGGDWKF